MGMLALTCAAINDAIAWCLLAFVVSVTRATPGGAIRHRRADGDLCRADVDRRAPRDDRDRGAARRRQAHRRAEPRAGAGRPCCCRRWPPSSSASTRSSARSCSARSSRTSSAIATHVTERIDDIVRVMFLPAFFAFTGLRTEIGLMQTADDWLLCGVIIVVATAGKFGGTLLASRARRPRLARQRGARHPDEHARPGRADRAEHRPRPRRDHAAPVHDAGDHGARHDADDVADPVGAAEVDARSKRSPAQQLNRFKHCASLLPFHRRCAHLLLPST